MGTGSYSDRTRKKAGSSGPAFSSFPGFDLERSFLQRGHRIIAGVDEAGRGALAGPLSVGLVIFPASIITGEADVLQGITDSKQLTPGRRDAGLAVIEECAAVARECFLSHRCVDRLNVNRATELAIRRLIEQSPVTPDLLLLDGTFKFDVGIPLVAVRGGDRRSLSIAAASIVAKVRRDRLMMRLDERYPGYGLAKNKGYGTAGHLEAIARRGPSPIHRESYEPVRTITGWSRDEDDRR